MTVKPPKTVFVKLHRQVKRKESEQGNLFSDLANAFNRVS
jgi:hypothetical protein